MRKLSALAFMLTITASLPAFAYTQEDVAACTPDAMRLCSAAIPDKSRVAHCLFQNKRVLSPACSGVFSRPRAASRERPARVQQTRF